jgi:hypothetical protein
LIISRVNSTIKSAPEKDGVKIVTMLIENAKAEELRRVTDIVRSKVKNLYCCGWFGI